MKALVLKEYGKFVVENVPLPEIGDNDVLVKVKACAICGSDIHGMDGSTGRRIPPVIMGHEASGIIVEVGKGVKRFNEGDRITFDSMINCGKCYYCTIGKTNLCDNRKVLGVSCEEYRRDGAFAEYVAIPERMLYLLPEGLSFEHAAMVEPLSIALHCINRIPVSINDTAVVVGTGMIGLLVVQMLKFSGCGCIIAVDLEEEKLRLACEFGAYKGLKADREDAAAEVLKFTQNRGADIAIEAVGITPAVNMAISVLRKGGSLSMVGNLSPVVEFPLQAVVTKELTLYGSCACAGEYSICLNMIAKGDINVDAFISATSSLDGAPAWFERLYSGEKGLMKVILKPNGA